MFGVMTGDFNRAGLVVGTLIRTHEKFLVKQ